jgi:hypothetical protein
VSPLSSAQLFIGGRHQIALKFEPVSTKHELVSAMSPARFLETLSFGWKQMTSLRQLPD